MVAEEAGVGGGAGGHRTGHELAEALAPKLISFRLREVGVSNQKDVPVAGDGTAEQLVVGHADSHDVGFLSCGGCGSWGISLSRWRRGNVEREETEMSAWGVRQTVTVETH